MGASGTELLLCSGFAQLATAESFGIRSRDAVLSLSASFQIFPVGLPAVCQNDHSALFRQAPTCDNVPCNCSRPTVRLQLSLNVDSSSLANIFPDKQRDVNTKSCLVGIRSSNPPAIRIIESTSLLRPTHSR